MIASLKSYSRIARVLLGVLGALLIVGIIGSLLMGVRAKRTAQDMVVSQARSIADSSLSLVFEPSDLTAPVGSIRAAELTEQIQGVVVDPSDVDQVTGRDVGESVAQQAALVLCFQQSPGNSTGP